jgi:TPR repeat protein
VISDSNPDAKIHYTLDGGVPTDNAPVYTEPFQNLQSGTVIRAMATVPGHSPSAIISGSYVWTTANYFRQAEEEFKAKRYDEARRHFGSACTDGTQEACDYLGFMYAQGLGGSPDEKKARTIYENGCERNDLKSCVGLGSLDHDAGKARLARTEFKKACDGGLAEACKLLGSLP